MKNKYNFKVVIPTSGIGSRLGELTNYTNKTLVRVGDKPALSYILESYPSDTSFVITLGYKGDLIKQFVNLCYPHLNIVYVCVDNYDKPGSSLLYSLSCAESQLQCPFIFHCSDAITHQSPPHSIEYNWLGIGDNVIDINEYCTINTNKSNVGHINPKGESCFDFIHIGIFGIFDYDIFWKTLKNTIMKNKIHELSDVDVINQMLNDRYEFKYIKYNDWLDVGNISALNDTKTKIQSNIVVLDKNNQSVFMLDNKIVKFFADPKCVYPRVKRAQKLYPMVPKIIGHATNFYTYEKIEGSLLSDKVNTINVKNFLNWCKNHLWAPSNIDIKDLCQKFYYDKTIQRITEFNNKTHIIDTIDNINEINIPKLEDILTRVNWDNIFNGVSTNYFHGDLHYNNILCTNNTYSLIDWRDDFGGDIDNGDVYYDLSKLYSGMLISHDIVLKNLFYIDRDKDKIKLDILIGYENTKCQEIFKQFVVDNNYDWNKIEILTALIFLNMAPLHHYPFDVFLYYLGKYQLHQLTTVQ